MSMKDGATPAFAEVETFVGVVGEDPDAVLAAMLEDGALLLEGDGPAGRVVG
jgi:hypothetical protein